MKKFYYFVFERQISDWDDLSEKEQLNLLKKVDALLENELLPQNFNAFMNCLRSNKTIQKRCYRLLGIYVPCNLIGWVMSKHFFVKEYGYNPKLELIDLISEK